MTKAILKVLSSAMFCIVLFCTPAGADQSNAAATADEVKQLDELRHGLTEALNHRDIDGMLRYLDPNVLVVWQNGEINQGPEAVRQYYNRMMVQGVVKSLSFDPVVQGRSCHGNFCVSVGTLQDTFVLNDGRTLALNSRWSATVIKSDGGGWKIAEFHASANVFDNPVIKIAARKAAMLSGGGGLLLGLVAGALFFRRRKA
jgi:ketosteroid isomerase-like protein